MDRLVVFVSSTFTDLTRERQAVEEVLRDMGAEPTLYPEGAAAGEPGRAFLSKLDNAHVMVYIATRESPWVAMELERAADLGLPVIELAERAGGRARYPEATEEFGKSRLVSIIRQQRSFGDIRELQDAVRSGIAATVARRFSSESYMRPLGDDVYPLGIKYLDLAQNHLGIVQRTASLVLGPRRDRLEQESRFIRTLRSKIAEVTSNTHSTLQITYVFDRDLTLSELRTHTNEYPLAQEAVDWMKDVMGRTNERVRFVAVRSPVSPLFLQDSTVCLSTYLGRVFWIEQQEAGKAATATWDHLMNWSRVALPLQPVLADALLQLEYAKASDLVELLDMTGQSIGSSSKLEAHEPPGKLHRGFSVFLFDNQGRTLIQRRAEGKYHFAGLWANACCSHPGLGADVFASAHDRLQYELGVTARLSSVGSFAYEAVDKVSHRVERELDEVLVGYVEPDIPLSPNQSEVAAIRFVALTDLQSDLEAHPTAYAPWVRQALDLVVASGHPKVSSERGH